MNQSAKQTLAYSLHLVSRFPAHIAPRWMESCSNVRESLVRAEVPTHVVPSADQHGAHFCLLYMQSVQLTRQSRILPITILLYLFLKSCEP